MNETTYNRIATACPIFAVGSVLAYELSDEYKWVAAGVAALTALTSAAIYIVYHWSVLSPANQKIRAIAKFPTVIRHVPVSGDSVKKPEEDQSVQSFFSAELISNLSAIDDNFSNKRNPIQNYFDLNIAVKKNRWGWFSGDAHFVVYKMKTGKSSGWSKLSGHKQRTSDNVEWYQYLADEEFKEQRFIENVVH